MDFVFCLNMVYIYTPYFDKSMKILPHESFPLYGGIGATCVCVCVCVCTYIYIYIYLFICMVGAGNFGRKLQATILDAPHKYMY